MISNKDDNMRTKKYLSFLALGSNYGDRNHYLSEALYRLSLSNRSEIDLISDIYQSPPYKSYGNSYYNQCLSLYTDFDPYELLNYSQIIENQLKRERPYPCSARTIDIDIILYEDIIINTETLILPHPEALKRNFVVMPLVEIYYMKRYEQLYDFLIQKDYDNDPWIIKLYKKGGLYGT